MRHSLYKTIGLGFLTVFMSAMFTNAFAHYDNNVYRAYYLDRHCNYYYVDAYGNKVITGPYVSYRNSGLTLLRDGHGRLFYKSALGNKMYVVKRCEMKCYKKVRGYSGGWKD